MIIMKSLQQARNDTEKLIERAKEKIERRH